MREGISEVCVVPEDMAREERGDGGAASSRVEHQDQDADICTGGEKEEREREIGRRW